MRLAHEHDEQWTFWVLTRHTKGSLCGIDVEYLFIFFISHKTVVVKFNNWERRVGELDTCELMNSFKLIADTVSDVMEVLRLILIAVMLPGHPKNQNHHPHRVYIYISTITPLSSCEKKRLSKGNIIYCSLNWRRMESSIQNLHTHTRLLTLSSFSPFFSCKEVASGHSENLEICN